MQPRLVDKVKVAFETQDTVKGKTNWEAGDHTLPGCVFALDRALMTELRKNFTHPRLTEPVSLWVIYESVNKGLLTGA